MTAPEGQTAASSPLSIVIVGGGFAGVQVARGLRRAPVALTLIDRRNFTLFQPLLYQVATGLLSPANIATPLRPLFARQANTNVLLGTVTDFDLAAHEVILEDGRVPFDVLVVAGGSRHQYFGHPEWEAHAPGLKSLEDAEDIRRRIFLAFERAERAHDPAVRARELCFVVVGGGPTSVELAGAVAEIAHRVTESGYRQLDHAAARVLLIEAEDRVLGSFSASSSYEAVSALRSLGVDVRLGSRVVDVTAESVTVQTAGDHGPVSETIATATILWGAGVRASPLAARLATAAGIALSSGGRIPVGPNCTIAGYSEVYVLGDMAAAQHDGRPLPGTAQVAVQQGDYLARVLAARAAGRALPAPFRYRERGNMATIGKRKAVADIGHWHLHGRLAWISWLALHLAQIIRFENRMLVLIQWAWAYVRWNRGASLVTGNDPDRPPSPAP